MASSLRALLIGGGLLLSLVAVPVGLLIYSPSWLGNEASVGRCADSGGTISDLRRGLGWLVSRGEVSNGKIAFTRSTEVASDIYVVDEEGTRETKLTQTNEFEVDPIWSPDGQKIAYSTSIYASLYVMNADGTNRTRLPGDVLAGRGRPAWSPDGEKIAYVDTSGELYVINADGTTEARLTTLFSGDSEDLTQTQLGNPAWSPDGERIAFARGAIPDTSTASAASRLTGIYLINVDGTGLCKLTSTAEENVLLGRGPVEGPVWSPDGEKIAFGDLGTINVINADGSGRRSLTNTPGVSYGGSPTWSPDSEKLAFSCSFLAPRNRHTDLCVINADGTGLKRAATEVAPVESPPVTSSWGRE